MKKRHKTLTAIILITILTTTSTAFLNIFTTPTPETTQKPSVTPQIQVQPNQPQRGETTTIKSTTKTVDTVIKEKTWEINNQKYTGDQIQHQFTNTGQQQIKLTVETQKGTKHTTTKTITIGTTRETQLTLNQQQDWIQGQHQNTHLKNQKLQLRQHKQQTQPERKQLNTQIQQIELHQNHILTQKPTKIQLKNLENLETQDKLEIFKKPINSLYKHNNQIYISENKSEDRDKTLHNIKIQNNELKHQWSKETPKDKETKYFTPITNTDKYLLIEQNGRTHILENQTTDQFRQQKTFDLDLTSEIAIDQNQQNIYLTTKDNSQTQITTIAKEDWNKKQKNIKETDTKAIKQLHHIEKDKFILNKQNKITLIEKHPVETEKYYKVHQETFSNTPVSKIENKNLHVAIPEKTKTYEIDKRQLKEQQTIERKATEPPRQIHIHNNKKYIFYDGNRHNYLEKQQKNYRAHRHYQTGTYTSKIFKLEDTKRLTNGNLEMKDNGQKIEITIKASDNPQMTNSEKQQVTPTGRYHRLPRLDIEGQYIQLIIEKQSNSWKTPQIKEIKLQN